MSRPKATGEPIMREVDLAKMSNSIVKSVPTIEVDWKWSHLSGEGLRLKGECINYS